MDLTKLLFYNEQYAKQNRNIKLVEDFIPLPKKNSVTGKFYSKYDAGSIEAPEEFVKIIERFTEMGPKDIYPYRPPAINMEYGWFTDPLIPRTSDPRLYFPSKQCDVVKTEIKIRDADKGVPREKFTGTPFYF